LPWLIYGNAPSSAIPSLIKWFLGCLSIIAPPSPTWRDDPVISNAISLEEIDLATAGLVGTFDMPCPLCGPCKSNRNQRRKVLRVWRIEAGFAGYHCARCGEKGYIHNRSAPAPDPIKLAKALVTASARSRIHKAKRLNLARWLRRLRRPLAGTIAERYLIEARGIRVPDWPATLGFLPARGGHPPCMIGAFGLAAEIKPGIIAINDSAIRGVHLTRLLPDGSGKATFEDPHEPAKIMIGHSVGWPIVLAPMNDGLALGITEGIEDGLSIRQALGIGVWAAGAASRMPALAKVVPAYTDTVTVFAHDDRDGQRHAAELERLLHARSIDAKIVSFTSRKGVA
jgi:hypothetical protein